MRGGADGRATLGYGRACGDVRARCPPSRAVRLVSEAAGAGALDRRAGAAVSFADMPEFTDILFLAATGAVACHALSWRNAEGKADGVRQLFGCIALLFFLRVLLVDVFGIV